MCKLCVIYLILCASYMVYILSPNCSIIKMNWFKHYCRRGVYHLGGHRIIDEFFELVSIDAISRNEREIADSVKVKLAELGCRVEEDDAATHIGGNTGNIYAVLDGTIEGSILLSAHLDRVANGYGIKPRIDGSRIVSDRTTILAADDISGVVAILDGVRRIKESGKPHPRIEIVFTVCEENGVLGSKYLDYSKIKSKVRLCIGFSGKNWTYNKSCSFKGPTKV